MITSSLEVAGLDGGRVNIPATALAELSSRMPGGSLRRGDEGWRDAVLLWNSAAAREPALVVRPTTARDVATAVTFAREHNVLLSIKGGGHNVAGTALADCGLTLDLSRMREVTVDTQARLAHVSGGALLKDVDRATQEHGLATVLGMMSETGVAGLTLGGGFGYLTRRFGWTVDNLEAVELVAADGNIVRANREQNADLFWAVRGGGGNFGVVTRFTYRLHAVGPRVKAGFVVWSGDRVADVLAAYRELTTSAPRELTAALFVLRAPPLPFLDAEWHGKVIVAIHVCHSGTNAEADLDVVRGVGTPLVDMIGDHAYTDVQSMFDDDLPKDGRYYMKSEFLRDLSSEFVDAFAEISLRVPSPPSEAMIVHIGGALNQRAADDGAVGNRDAHYVLWFDGAWPLGARGDEHIAWTREGWERTRRFSVGGNYLNFQSADEDEGRVRAMYGPNFDRLRVMKSKYDPTNLFRVNRNIPPVSDCVRADAVD